MPAAPFDCDVRAVEPAGAAATTRTSQSNGAAGMAPQYKMTAHDDMVLGAPVGAEAMAAEMIVTTEYVDIAAGGGPMRTFVAAPSAPGPHPGVLFYSDIF